MIQQYTYFLCNKKFIQLYTIIIFLATNISFIDVLLFTTFYIISLRLSVSFLIVNCCTFDQCLKYKTDQAQEAKKMEKLNNIFFALMARGPDGMSLP